MILEFSLVHIRSLNCAKYQGNEILFGHALVGLKSDDFWGENAFYEHRLASFFGSYK